MSSMVKCVCCLCIVIFSVSAKTYVGNPSNYLQKRDSLQAGDSLLLEPGDYTGGLSLTDMHGADNNWIVITAQDSHAAVLVARDWNNTMNMKNSSYIKIMGLTFDGKGYDAIDAIKAQGDEADYTHHIWIENNIIKDHSGGQQTVGINTKITCWDWTIRCNTVIEAGTGIYLGGSEGDTPFIRGLIEFNLVLNPIGYCMQIKQQNDRPNITGIPMEDVTTVIRHNVFAKDDRPSPSGDRPNLLVSGTFEQGPGSKDRYEIYGNFLFYNPRESLFQGSGNISLHNNIFAVSDVRAVNFQEHHSRKPKELFVYCNTFYNTNSGLRLSGADTNYDQIFKGNAVYTASPVSGITGFETDNKVGAVAEAASVFVSSTDSIGTMDFYPVAGALQGNIDLSGFSSKDAAWNLDFNNKPQSGAFYGAYSGEGTNPGWKLALDIKEIGIVGIKDFSKYTKNKRSISLSITNGVITFSTPCATSVSLGIFSVAGRHIVKLLRNNPVKGKQTIPIPTGKLSGGMFLVRLETEKEVINKRMVLVD